MGLRARILKLVSPDYGGPRSRRVLEALARTAKQRHRAGTIIDTMLASGELVMYGTRRGATYGQPGYRKPRRNTA